MNFQIKIALVVAFLGIIFGAFFRGAPYVPTRKKQVEAALDLLNLPEGALVVDLGSGDGVFLKMAAQRGLRALGYEINPILCLISWLRCWRYRYKVKIFWRDFWITNLPEDVDAIFVFLGGIYMPKLSFWLKKISNDRKKSLYVASYAFNIPDQQLIRSHHGINLYKIEP